MQLLLWLLRAITYGSFLCFVCVKCAIMGSFHQIEFDRGIHQPSRAALLFQEVCPLFDPCFAQYDEPLSHYEQLHLATRSKPWELTVDRLKGRGRAQETEIWSVLTQVLQVYWILAAPCLFERMWCFSINIHPWCSDRLHASRTLPGLLGGLAEQLSEHFNCGSPFMQSTMTDTRCWHLIRCEVVARLKFTELINPCVCHCKISQAIFFWM